MNLEELKNMALATILFSLSLILLMQNLELHF